MNDDELRTRLARLDPQAGASVAPIPSELKERTMTTTLETDTATARSRRPRLLVAAAAVVAVAAAGTAYAVLQDDDPAPTEAPTVLALTAAPLDVSSICAPISAEGIARATVAFAGTVTAVEGTAATLDVTQWFRGGDADQVRVTQQGGADAAALDGVAFRSGVTYLVASDGTSIPSCSGSGPDGPELRALFDQAFS